MKHHVIAGLFIFAAGGLAPAADEILFDFENNFDSAKVTNWDVKLSAIKNDAGTALRVASGHKEKWPGITLTAPRKQWDLSRFDYIAVDVKNVGTRDVTVFCRVDNPGADGVRNCNTANLLIKPGEQQTLKVHFIRSGLPELSKKLFGMRGYPPGIQGSDGAIDPARINQVLVFLAMPGEDYLFEVDNIRAGGAYTPPPQALSDPKTFFPFIDSFGQYMHADWPGKTHSLDELKARAENEAKELKEKPGPRDWDPYGGWKDGPLLDAKGFFYAAKHDGKWWLVDPDGRLFFSHGIDCVNTWGESPIEGRAAWFRDFPGEAAEFKAFLTKPWQVLHGHYKGQRPACFDFTKANLFRKYGAEWQNKFADIAHQRLRSWGMNTIANWSDSAVYLQRKTPYTATLGADGTILHGSEGYWGQFKDVFDPSFKASLQKKMAWEKGKSAGDPWCIGFFIDNELAWGDDTSLALATLKSPSDQTAKKVFVDDLKTKYGEIEKLNAAWGTSHTSWDALLQSQNPPDKKKAGADLGAFYTKFAEQYFKTCRDTVKEAAPNQLYLGCRFAWVNNRAAEAAAKFCDVVSYNLYRRDIANFQFPGNADVPLLVGEFHLGALDRGMFHPGLVPLKDQAERAATYISYVEGALRHPRFVGTHWFQYMDEPTLGRSLDEENYQIGFVDNVDTPYAETISACREVGYGMYLRRAGK